MPSFGDRPEDVVTDLHGNVQSGVVLTLYASQSDATAKNAALATVTTSSTGRWSYTNASVTVVWVRTPAGDIYPCASDTGAGVTAHSALTGLGNDDHTQYYNQARGDARYGKRAPWQFRPADYGALGDGKMVTDVATTSGSAVITSATANWSIADVGKYIMVNGGLDIAGGPLIGTIATYNSPTQVTLSANAARTGTGLPAVWGTDDTIAINNAVSDAWTYALNNRYYAEISFDDKTYVLAGAPSQSVTPQFNAQIQVPYPNRNGTSRKLVFAFKGSGRADHAHYWKSTSPNLAGTSLVSMQTAPVTPDATYGIQSVIGGPSAGGAFTGGFANTKVVIENLSVFCPAYTNMTAFDFTWLGGMRTDGASAHIFAAPIDGPEPVLNSMPAQSFFQGRRGVGLRTPAFGNNADNYSPSFATQGYNLGVYFGDHAGFGRLLTVYNDLAGYIDSTIGVTNVAHNLTIENWAAEAYNGGLKANGGYVHVNVVMASECVAPSYDVSDSANAMHGEIWWTDPSDNRAVSVTGAANVTFHNNKLSTVRYGGATIPRVYTLTDAATIAVDASLGNDFRVTLAGNRTLGAPTNPADGQTISIQVAQDATGTRTLAYDAVYSFGAGVAPTLSTAASKVDILRFVYNAAKAKWLYLGSSLGF